MSHSCLVPQEIERAKIEEAVQKWQRTAIKAQRHAEACYAEAQAKAEEAAEATSQVSHICPLYHRLVDCKRVVSILLY